ncbi:MAG: hypothetical protein ACP5PT_08190 [Brevinematia bacterium]
MEPVFVKITPIEFQRKGKTRNYDRIIIYTEIKLNKNLTQQKFNEILEKIPLKQKAHGICNPRHYLIYNYGCECLVVFDLETGEVFTTKTALEYYGRMAAQIQASIILKILKRFRQAAFKRIILSSYRLGNSLEDFKERVEAYGNLLNKKIKVVEED